MRVLQELSEAWVENGVKQEELTDKVESTPVFETPYLTVESSRTPPSGPSG